MFEFLMKLNFEFKCKWQHGRVASTLARPPHITGSTPPKRPNTTIQQKVPNCSNATKGLQCFYQMIKKAHQLPKGHQCIASI